MNLSGRDLHRELFGDDVKQLQSELAQLGFRISADEMGRGMFAGSTADAVISFQKQQGLDSNGLVEAVTAAALSKAIALLRQKFNVAGQLFSSTRVGVGGLRVLVVDKAAGPDTTLAATTTDANGRYAVQFGMDLLKQTGKTVPDLQAQAFAGDKLIGASVVRYSAGTSETLDINLPATADAILLSEHETLTGAVAPLLRGNLRDLKEGGGRSDITYLANKTGWDARAVALAALADQFSAQADGKIPAAYFYALFRAGLPANADALYHIGGDTLTAIWKGAVTGGVIPAKSAYGIPEMVKAFQSLSADRLLTTPVFAGASSFGDMLSLAGLGAPQQRQVAALYATHDGDLPGFWKAVSEAVGAPTAEKLKTQGKLAFLTLNNAPLMKALDGVGDPLKLVQQGFHDPARWKELIKPEQVPPQIPGANAQERAANYAGYLAAQLRISYPTAAIAQMIGAGAVKLDNGPAVVKFLTEQQGKFELTAKPIKQYLAQNNISAEKATTEAIQRVQRALKLTPNDAAMGALIESELDSAYHIVQQDRSGFIRALGKKMGGEDVAARVYDRAVQVHGAVLNLTIGFLSAKNAAPLGAIQMGPLNANGAAVGGQFLDARPQAKNVDATSVIAYPTLESLFGSMDFCSCDECRSILSPAAYLVDLLQFIDKAADGKQNAQSVLFNRRPDIQHLPLTCENTNTVLPYIDIVNETLEFYVANAAGPLTLTGFQGHDTGAAVSDDLLASPQYVMDQAYTVLQGAWFPSPLPFHRPLEALRRHFDQFEAPLPDAMERLRQSDDLERGANAYGWRDILMEALKLSRPEYRVLSDSALTLNALYGFAAGKTEAQLIAALSNAKAFARRVTVSYEDLVAILKTRFINPNCGLVPKLARLNVPFSTLQAVHDGTITGPAFLALLPVGAGAPDPAEFGGDIVAWVKDPQNYARLMSIITLVDPTGKSTGCNFDRLEFRYSKPVANPGDTSTRLTAVDFVRLLRFIRLYQKTGWTIEQTDIAICSLYRPDCGPITAGDLDTLAKLDAGFSTLLPRLGVAVRVLDALSLAPAKALQRLLAVWSDIPTQGASALYRTMFIAPSTPNRDPAFADNGYGEYLTDAAQRVLGHAEALRGAFNLSGDEFEQIVKALGFDANTPLTLANISAIYRRGWLARSLKLSVRELLLLTGLTGIDPFAPPDIGAAPNAAPPITRLIELVQSLKESGMKSAAALYLVWNQDLSGQSAPKPDAIAAFARTLRADFAAIDNQFAVTDDPTGDVLQARMTLVYGQAVADAFIALIDNTTRFDVAYTHPSGALEAAITALDPALAYDDFVHRLSHKGLLSKTMRDALVATAGVQQAFKDAVGALYDASSDALASFFSRNPELKPLYDAYVASAQPPEQKRTALLAAFQPELSRRRKSEQALDRLGGAAGLDLAGATALLAPDGAGPFPLHAAGNAGRSVLDDVLALGTPGLAAQFFFRNAPTGVVDQSVAAAPAIDYSAANPLPANPVAGAAISGIWTGSVEIPDAGYYNFVISTDATALVTLTFDGTPQPLTRNGAVWRNQNPLLLAAGRLVDIVLKVERVVTNLSLSWETPKAARAVIPGRYLYPPSIMPPFSAAYVRIMKAASLATGLKLSAAEIAHFATDPDYRIAGEGWLNLLPVSGDPLAATAVGLLAPLKALLAFSRLKAEWSPDDDRLLSVLKDSAAATTAPDGVLFKLSLWDPVSLTDMLKHFGKAPADLAHFAVLRRLERAFATVTAMGISAASLIKATTNEPTAAVVRDFQAALKARYAADDWRDIIKPINDALRELQRDALVAYILQQFKENPPTPAAANIDTPDKLYEYFLMDVEMASCAKTSRIRLALSSAQLFIERCLMNLEADVSPGSIDSKQWRWRKRFRLWQANREVFIHTENWLEQELRDDKSPFFKDIEGQLLQADITDDSAGQAVLGYLSKLSDVAHLVPCGLCIEENGAGEADDIIHVVARAGAGSTNFYYRRYEYGYWTAWEQIKLKIEDAPVIPVVWNNRLLLFWLNFLKQTPQSAPDPGAASTANGGTTHVSDLSLTQVRAAVKNTSDAEVKVRLQALLSWSEYYNGQWQPPQTSDAAQPADLGAYSPLEMTLIDRSQLSLWSDEPAEGLRISIHGAHQNAAFRLYNTHSTPELMTPLPSYRPFGKQRSFSQSGQPYTINYSSRIPDLPPVYYAREVLTDSIPVRSVQAAHGVSDQWTSPFFFEDRRNVFFVTTTEKQVWVADFGGYGVFPKPSLPEITKLPPIYVQPPLFPKPTPWGGPEGILPGVVDPAPIERFVTQDANIRQGIAVAATVKFGGVDIGPAGAIDVSAPAPVLVRPG
ncbi:MAG: neuraminidase-like domain-containing protein [Methylocystis sp.]|uniref:neuraminidase-like domain-containing protein n=1 Tax=Methylocystis sp. TaxID=1911079 RepID=UPI003DA5259B